MISLFNVVCWINDSCAGRLMMPYNISRYFASSEKAKKIQGILNKALGYENFGRIAREDFVVKPAVRGKYSLKGFDVNDDLYVPDDGRNEPQVVLRESSRRKKESSPDFSKARGGVRRTKIDTKVRRIIDRNDNELNDVDLLDMKFGPWEKSRRSE